MSQMRPYTKPTIASRRSAWPLHTPAQQNVDELADQPRIVAIGGGTGLPAVLRGLADVFSGELRPPKDALDRLTAVVTVTDDGGSSGRLRRELGILPPGDIRSCLVALAEHPSLMAELLQHRFVGANSLEGHSVGNLLLAALTQMTGDLTTAVERLGEILALRGRVLPSTQEDVHLRAEFEGGSVIEGETAIVAERRRIKRLSLVKKVQPLPETLRALINADAVVVGPGSLYTSVLPNLLVDGIASTLSGVNAVRIYVANLMTEPGETDGFSLDDHLRIIREHVQPHLFDYVLVNRRPVEAWLAAEYELRGSYPVRYDGPSREAGFATIVEADLASELAEGKIRHAPAQLAEAILELVEQGRREAIDCGHRHN